MTVSGECDIRSAFPVYIPNYKMPECDIKYKWKENLEDLFQVQIEYEANVNTYGQYRMVDRYSTEYSSFKHLEEKNVGFTAEVKSSEWILKDDNKLNTHLDFVLQETELDAEYTSLAGNKKGKLKKNNRLTVN